MSKKLTRTVNSPVHGKVRLIKGGVDLLDRVGPLWEQLNTLHSKKSPHLGPAIARRSFLDRKQELTGKADRGKILVLLAVGYEDDCIGYCISTIETSSNRERSVGEIDSIFVLDSYRKQGIGQILMKESLQWFAINAVEGVLVSVAIGNEDVLPFYESFGFMSRSIHLQLANP